MGSNNNDSRGFSQLLYKVYLPDLKKLIPCVATLAGLSRSRLTTAQVTLLNKTVADQLSDISNDPMWVTRLDRNGAPMGQAVEVHSLSEALRLVPCELELDSGLDLCPDLCAEGKKDSKDFVRPVITITKTSNRWNKSLKPYRGSIAYLASEGWLEPMHYIEKLAETVKLVADCCGLTSAQIVHRLRRALIVCYEETVLNGLGVPFTPKSGGPDVLLRFREAETPNGGFCLRPQVDDFLKLPDCPVSRKIFRSVTLNTERLQALSDLAEEERSLMKWAFVRDGEFGRSTDNLYGLQFYLHNIVDRAAEDTEWAGERRPGIIYYNGNRDLCFCTGLFERGSDRFIYAVCHRPAETGFFESVEWIPASPADPKRDPRLPSRVSSENDGLPFPADWSRNPEELICIADGLRNLEDRIDYKHIFDPEHCERLPETCFTVAPNHERQLNSNGARCQIRDAVRVAARRVMTDHNYAIPGYYQGKIYLLLPLCLEDSLWPNAYLALVREPLPESSVPVTDEPPKTGLRATQEIRAEQRANAGLRTFRYRAPTLLTPLMAYSCARTVSNPGGNPWEKLFDELAQGHAVATGTDSHMNLMRLEPAIVHLHSGAGTESYCC